MPSEQKLSVDCSGLADTIKTQLNAQGHRESDVIWDPRATAVKQDPHCATCKCFSEEPEALGAGC